LLVEFPLDGILQAHETSVSETYAFGGALAYQYGTAGNLNALSDAVIRQALSDRNFGTAPQGIKIQGGNQAPTLAFPIADQTAQEYAEFRFTASADTFSDADVGDVLIYCATLSSGAPLPSWLLFDPATRTFSGTPGAGDAGTFSIRAKATDFAGASMFDDFLLTVGRGVQGVHLMGTPHDDDDHDHGHQHGQDDDPHGKQGSGKHDDRNDDHTEHHKPDLAGLLEAYLARRPEYEFEALARELERSNHHRETLSAHEIARHWQAVDRYVNGLADERDEDARHGAGEWRGFDALSLLGGGSTGGAFGHAGSTGGAHGMANLKTLPGLEEGFHRLRT
jgi:hypothetical protein